MKGIFKKKDKSDQGEPTVEFVNFKGEQPVEYKSEQPVAQESEQPVAQDPEQFDNRMFCVCRKCNSKLYTHVGFKEHPEGVYNIYIACPKCGENFTFTYATQKGKAGLQAKGLIPVVKEVMKQMDKGGEE